MKKLILSVFVLVVCFSASAQFTSYRNHFALWNKSTKKWDWENVKEAYIPIEFNKNSIKLQNKRNSVYTISEDLGEKISYTEEGVKVTSHSWDAYDENGKKCKVTMSIFNSDEYDPLILSVMYDDVMVRFYCKKDGYDKLIK